MAEPTAPAERFRSVAARFGDVVGGVRDWDAPTPVEQWRARDVVGHLVGWLPGFVRGGTGLELAPGPSAQEDPAGAWDHLRSEVQALLEDPERSATTYRGQMFPDLPLGQAVDQFFTTDVFMHTWDLARSSGQDDTLDPEVIGPMLEGMRRMEDVIRASGQFGVEQPVPEDATLQDRFIAFLGRDPRWRPPAG